MIHQKIFHLMVMAMLSEVQPKSGNLKVMISIKFSPKDLYHPRAVVLGHLILLKVFFLN